MRIDISMTLGQPEIPNTKNGLEFPDCTQEYLLIGKFKLCGVQTKQHLYVPIDKKAGMDSLEIVFKTAQRKGLSKLPPLSWNLEVTQLECPDGISLFRSSQPEGRARGKKDGFLLAPAGCDQYYPETEGTVRSFNFNDGEGLYPFNLTYAMCFRRTPTTTGLLINAEAFNLPQESDGVTIFAQTDTQCYPQLPTEGRIDDYLMIPQAQVQENEVRANYFCGESINGYRVLSTMPGPMSIVFHSGSVYRKGTKSQGFSLDYQVISS
ncbi:uncharacterized protein LOC129911758 [Episyrphus balteatus]|uniref:uncharacterized protein LOC129911758 n=1 Tax=Episyrphus balteatus TaxID=286459 RepID=UPI002485551D|nr:uncharacterized protein LOC129911758 [Episyrphus balteatus]